MPLQDYYISPNERVASTFSNYQTHRDRLYGQGEYTPDPFLGLRTNQEEKDLLRKNLKGRDPHAAVDPANVTCVLQPSELEYGGPHLLRFSDPLIDAYAQVGYSRASQQLQLWREGPHYPDDAAVCANNPGVDPAGKFCAVDMDFAQRIARLKAVAPLTNPQRHPALITAFENLQNRSGPLADLTREVEKTCCAIRETERAAKLCPHAQASAMLSAGAKQLANEAPCLKQMDQYLTALEHVAGLRRNTPSREVLATARDLGIAPTLVTQQAPLIPVDKLDLQFQNFDNVIHQRYFATPNNWGLAPEALQREPADAGALSQHVETFAEATVGFSLDGAYAGRESQFREPNCNTRATMIIVDGMTVAERMAAEYQKMTETHDAWVQRVRDNEQAARDRGEKVQPQKIPPLQGYTEWYKTNLQDRTNKYVAAALTQGKRVEAFIPNQDGTLPKEPVQLTASGYKPSPLRPVTMNAWERFWSRYGFYKEKQAKIDEYRRFSDARERVQAKYELGMITEKSITHPQYREMFFGDYLRAHGHNDLGAFQDTLHPNNPMKTIQRDRSSYTTLAICAMAAHGIEMKDILDPQAMVAEKQAIGGMILERACMDPATGQPGNAQGNRIGDTSWIGAVYMQGQQAILGQIDRMMNGVDVQDMQQMRKIQPYVSACADVIFDVSQDKVKPGFAAGYNNYAEQLAPGNGRALAERTDELCANAAGAIRLLEKGQMAVFDIAAPRAVHTDTALCYLAQAKHTATMTSGRGGTFSAQAPAYRQNNNVYAALAGCAGLQDIAQDVLDNRGDWQRITKLAINGDLMAGMNIHNGARGMNVTLKPNVQCAIRGVPYVPPQPSAGNLVK